MNAQLIEQLDSRRYKYLMWQTIGFGLFFAGIIIGPHLTGKEAWTAVIYSLTGLGVGVFLAATLKSNRNERQIKGDPELRKALNNELVRLYGYKSVMYAFYVTLAAAFLFVLASNWIDGLTARLACTMLIYISCLTLMIARLVYLRR